MMIALSPRKFPQAHFSRIVTCNGSCTVQGTSHCSCLEHCFLFSSVQTWTWGHLRRSVDVCNHKSKQWTTVSLFYFSFWCCCLQFFGFGELENENFQVYLWNFYFSNRPPLLLLSLKVCIFFLSISFSAWDRVTGPPHAVLSFSCLCQNNLHFITWSPCSKKLIGMNKPFDQFIQVFLAREMRVAKRATVQRKKVQRKQRLYKPRKSESNPSGCSSCLQMQQIKAKSVIWQCNWMASRAKHWSACLQARHTQTADAQQKADSSLVPDEWWKKNGWQTFATTLNIKPQTLCHAMYIHPVLWKGGSHFRWDFNTATSCSIPHWQGLRTLT